jgi:hypothetical protein
LALPALVALGASLPEVSAAGGWWSSIDLKRAYVAQGEHVRAGTEFLFRSLETADRARREGRFSAYLLADFDFDVVETAMGKASPRGWWRLGDAIPMRMGPVRLHHWDGNLAHASAEFDVPALDPGRYALMFCDAGCAHPLGDIVPVSLTVVRDPLTARTASRLAALEFETATEQAKMRARVRGLRAELAAVTLDNQSLRESVAAANQRLDRLARREPASSVPWWAWAGWAVAGSTTVLAIAVMVSRRRRWRRLPHALDGPLGNGHDRIRVPAAAARDESGREGARYM